MLDDTRLRLIEAAGPAFAQKGFAGTGIREICQAAEANIAAVNYHFGDKQGLYLACLQLAQSCESAQLGLDQFPKEASPPDRLRMFVRSMLTSKLTPDRPRWHLELMLREMVRPSDACRDMVEQYIRPMADFLWQILEPLAPGWNRNDPRGWMIGFSIVGQILFYYIQQPMIRLLVGDELYAQLTIDELTDHITDFCLAALGHGAPLIHPSLSEKP